MVDGKKIIKFIETNSLIKIYGFISFIPNLIALKFLFIIDTFKNDIWAFYN